MRLKVLRMSLVILGSLLLTLVPTVTMSATSTQGSLDLLAKPIVVEPSLTCNRADSHPKLQLLVTNSSSSNVPAGRRIHLAYQLKPDNKSGEGTVQLTSSLLPGQTLKVSLSDVNANSFQTCSATLMTSLIGGHHLIKLPYVVAPRRP